MLSFFRSHLVISAFAALCLAFAAAAPVRSQEATDQSAAVGQEHILLVLPFDNLTDAVPAAQTTPATGQTNGNPDPTTLDWIREAVPEILNSRFTSAGFFPLTREDRLYALDHLGLPETFEPSRATALRIAETLDANYVLIGNYRVEGSTLTLQARIIDVAKLRLSDPISESGQIAQLIPLLNSLAWQLTRKLDPGFNVAEETFRAAGAHIRLDAFEQYIRGITERDLNERLGHLKKATELSPDFSAAWLAMGKLQFASQQYEQAAVSFGKVTRPSTGSGAASGSGSGSGSGSDPAALEAGFYRGLSLIFSGNYPRAEDAFSAVARVLPLPEVINNQAVAISRRGHDAVALFRQAEAADPTDSDYHFNLAVSLHRHGDNAEALTELTQSLKLHANDSEAKALQDSWQSSAPSTDQASRTGSDALERIKRTYDGPAFRQASLMVDQVESARLAALPGPERASRLNASAHEKLNRGLLLEAERGYQAALAADDRNAEAHAGLAQVRERAGDTEGARKEAQEALQRKPNLDAYLILARLDLAENHLPEARDEADQAIKLDASSRAAKDLRKTIDAHIESRSASDAKPGTPSTTTTKP